VASQDRNLAIAASAGTGKTHALVRELLSALLLGAEPLLPHQVVATTFSTKAALELEERLRHVLRELASGNNERYSFDLHPRALIERSKEVLRLLFQCRIRTIHSLAIQILRTFAKSDAAPEDLSENFEILAESESRQLLLQCAADVIEAAAVDAASRTARLIEHAGGVEQLLHALASAVESDGEQSLQRAQVKAERPSKGIETFWQEFLNIVRALASESPTYGPSAKTLLAVASEPESSATRAALHDALLALLDKRMPAKGKTAADAALSEFVAGLRGDDKADKGLRLLSLYWLRAEFDAVTDELESMLAAVRELYLNRQRELDAYSFGTALAQAASVLCDHPLFGRELAKGIKLLLVDECQDISPLQRDLICLLRADAVESAFDAREAGEVPTPHAIAERGLVIVGDRKQSIYGFRGADVSVFASLAVAIAGEPARVALGQRDVPEWRSLNTSGALATLTTNYRSHAQILKFVNAMSARLFEPADLPEPYEVVYTESDVLHVPEGREESADAHPEQHASILPGAVWDPVAIEESSKPMDEMRAILGWISAFRKQGLPYRAIAVLGQSNAFLAGLATVLSEHGVPFVAAGANFYATKEVRDLRSMLAYLADPADTAAKWAVLRGPFCGLLDESLARLARDDDASDLALSERARWQACEAVVKRARAALPLSGPARTLRSVVAELQLFAVYKLLPGGQQKIANAEKLLRRLEQLSTAGLALRFLDTVFDQREFEATMAMPESDAVLLLTAHASKGLSFPVVILPQVSRLARTADASFARTSPQGLAVSLRSDEGTLVSSPLVKQVEQTRVLRDRAERQRVWYVACTRAEQHMVFVGNRPQRGKQRPFSALLAELQSAGELTINTAPCEPEAAGAREVASPPPEQSPELLQQPQEPVRSYFEGAAPVDIPEPLAPLPAERNKRPNKQLLQLHAATAADFLDCPKRYHYKHRLGLLEAGPGVGPLAHAACSLRERMLTRADWRSLSASDVARMARACTNDPSQVAKLVALGERLLTSSYYARLQTDAARVLPAFTFQSEAFGVSLLAVVYLLVLWKDGTCDLIDDADLLVSEAALRPTQLQRLTALALAPKLGDVRVRLGSLALLHEPEPSFFPIEHPALPSGVPTLGKDLRAAADSDSYPKVALDTCQRIQCGFVERCYPSRAGEPASET
jgi:ATP-dependent helicase/nuclease subunit A